MKVCKFSIAQELEIFEFADTAPEVIRVHHHPIVRMVRLADQFQRGRQRRREARRSRELEHERDAERLRNLGSLAHVVNALLVVIFRVHARSCRWSDEAIGSDGFREFNFPLQIFQSLCARIAGFGELQLIAG